MPESGKSHPSFQDVEKHRSEIEEKDNNPDQHQVEEREMQGVFDEYCSDQPGYFEANELVADFKKLAENRNKKEKRNKKDLCRKIVVSFFNTPNFLENFLFQLERLEKFNVSDREVVLEIVDVLLERPFLSKVIADENLVLDRQKQEVMDSWLKFLVKDGTLIQGVAFSLLHESFNRSRKQKFTSADSLVDVAKKIKPYAEQLYTLAYAAIKSDNDEETKVGMDALMGENDVKCAGKEEKELDSSYFLACLFSVDEEVYAMTKSVYRSLIYSVVYDGKKKLEQFYGELEDIKRLRGGEFRKKREKTGKVWPTDSYDSLLADSLATDPKRGDRMLKQILRGAPPPTDPVGKSLVLRAADRNDIEAGAELYTHYPFNLFSDASKAPPLMEVYQEKMRRLRGESHHILVIPNLQTRVDVLGLGKEKILPEEIKKFFVSEKGGEKWRITDDKVFETVALLFPKLDEESVQKIEGRIKELRKSLKYEVDYLVAPRGDKAIIKDARLEELGFKDIVFKPQSSVTDLEVTVRIGDTEAVLKLNGDYELISADEEGKGQGLDVSKNAKLKVTELILSHLNLLLSNIKNKSGQRKEAGEIVESEEGPGQTVSAVRPHPRKLGKRRDSTWKQYTFGQWKRSRKEYGIDLVKYNFSRGGGDKIGYWTFVFPDEQSVPFQNAKKMPPSESTVENATNIFAITNS